MYINSESTIHNFYKATNFKLMKSFYYCLVYRKLYEKNIDFKADNFSNICHTLANE